LRKIEQQDFAPIEMSGMRWLSLPQLLYAGFALALILAGSVLLIPRKADLEMAKAGNETTRHAVLVHTWQLSPAYTFRKDAGGVIDSLTFRTNEVTVTLWLGGD
jgi:hypothetical protein